MKLIKIRPRLVDHTLLKPKSKPKPKPKPIPIPKETGNELSFYFNIIGMIILGIGIYCLYRRFVDKKQIEEKKTQSIVDFHIEVNQYLDQQKFKR